MSFALKKLAAVIYKQPSRRYLTYIRSPQWGLIRRAHLESVDYWCEHCHKAKACQVHHWNYKHLGSEMPWDLYAVCVPCHHKLHMLVEPANDNRQIDLFTAEPPADEEAAANDNSPRKDEEVA